MISPRLQATRELLSNKDISDKELQVEDVRVNFHAVPPEFLRNKNIPVAPELQKALEEKKEAEIHRWADLEDFED